MKVKDIVYVIWKINRVINGKTDFYLTVLYMCCLYHLVVYSISSCCWSRIKSYITACCLNGGAAGVWAVLNPLLMHSYKYSEKY